MEMHTLTMEEKTLLTMLFPWKLTHKFNMIPIKLSMSFVGRSWQIDGQVYVVNKRYQIFKKLSKDQNHER